MSFVRSSAAFRASNLSTRSFLSRKPTSMAGFFKPSHPVGLGLAGSASVFTAFNVPSLVARRRYSSGRNDYSHNYDTSMKVLYAAIAANCGVFAYYWYVKTQAQQGAPRPLMKFVQNFTLNLTVFQKENRWWTILTSCFTHFGPLHLLGNMLSIYYFGRILAETPQIGPARIVTLIIGSGILGSVGHLATRAQQTGSSIDRTRALGFSGAVMGVGAVAACLQPKATFLIYGIIPAPLWALIAGYGIYDGYYLGSENTGIGHAGHLGGLAFGLAYYLARIRILGI